MTSTRRLAAILAADVAGYSRLMGADEEGTLSALKALRRELADPKIKEHRGRIVKTTGDGLLVEFASVLDAVRCAVEVQREMAARNAQIPAERRVEFRVGINLGDIIIDEDDIFGDGVNVAARLEALAEPGGICVSRVVRDQVRDKLDFAFEDKGEQQVKNIARPIHVFGLSFAAAAAAAAPADPPAHAAPAGQKPSLAILPFQNMSGDPEQEYFADGIVEDITTAIARLSWLSVTARNSAFTHKGQAIDVKQVARDLGVRYLLEGSVRKAGSQVRITGQLIDAATGHHVWAERYDRQLADVFAVQDEITQNIIGAIAPGILSAEILNAQRKDASQLDVWDLVMRAHWHIRRFTPDDLAQARILLAEAIARDPANSTALIDLGYANHFEAVFGWGGEIAESHARFGDAARQAVAANDRDAAAHAALALHDLFSGRHEDAARRLRRALVLDPNLVVGHRLLGVAAAFEGDCAAAISLLEEAIRLSPRDPFVVICRVNMAWASLSVRHDEEAADYAEQAIAENAAFPDSYAVLAAANGHLGKTADARRALDELARRMPDLTTADERLARPFRRPNDRARFLEGLNLAGMPKG